MVVTVVAGIEIRVAVTVEPMPVVVVVPVPVVDQVAQVGVIDVQAARSRVKTGSRLVHVGGAGDDGGDQVNRTACDREQLPHR